LETSDDRKSAERSLYDSVNRLINEHEFGRTALFLNFGYEPDGGPNFARVPLTDGRPGLQSARLVLETVGDCPVEGRDVLDVGCGRGGTLSVVREFFHPRTVTGVDLSPEAVRFCRASYEEDNARFLEGDAEDLPFADESFDVVTNIESACLYPDINAFYREVRRVLRPGGHFLYADSIAREVLDARLDALGRLFTVERFRDITRNVLLSCDEIAERRMRLFGDAFAESFLAGVRHDAKPKSYDKLLAQLFCAPGSKNYRRMQEGADLYVIVKLRKDG
jgi:ubiquinone/menaquinone biosynthesis C-methylase UbiE